MLGGAEVPYEEMTERAEVPDEEWGDDESPLFE